MIEEIEIQTINEVAQIDHRKSIQNQINEQAIVQDDNMNQINDKLDTIINTSPVTTDVDLTEVTDMIASIDTDIIAAQNESMIEITQEQTDKIDNLENRLNNLEEKIDLILEKM